MVLDRLNEDLKAALLAHDALQVSTLRGLKTALQYAALQERVALTSLSDEQAMTVLRREAKKRQESADLYRQGGDETRARQELREKEMIEHYLPAPVPDSAIEEAVAWTVTQLGEQATLGLVIAQVKGLLPSADGASIARITREKLQR